MKVYLDYAAATPVSPEVLSVMQPYFSDKFYNPSALYLAAKDVRKDIEMARQQVANVLGARPNEIIFTAGASEANNLAIRGAMENYPDSNIVISTIEHDSVLNTAKNYIFKLAKVDNSGIIDLTDLDKQIDDQTVLVSVMLANNEIGTLQPIKQIASLISKRRALRKNNLPLLLHTDAAQAANYLDLHVSRLGIDLMSLNGGKIYGPKQSGALYVKNGVLLKPLIYGGGQERGLRSGTENTANIMGFATALSLAQELRHLESDRLNKLKAELLELLEAKKTAWELNGHKLKRLPNNLHLTFPGVDAERLLMQLDEVGIAAASGSACSASSDLPSHVLKAIAKSDQAARSSVRISLGRFSSSKDIELVAHALLKLI